jgi:hypothetical protein
MSEANLLQTALNDFEGRLLFGDKQYAASRGGQARNRLVIVWLFPVPGGPWITLLWSARTAAIARCWLESASSTKNSLSSGIRSNSLGSGSAHMYQQ